ncbi:tyrosine-type recombinase/integrase [Aurantimonas aggregata]|uniref:Tyrosine-type recombinase/integrase n=1 Tax=Aurantimonas aggregata TaxID=2047720 RepID=A0A6L9MM15_9HYPH|nr:tyrosine-type recombinase/integrase [Aurantimonas aggregata]
MSVRKRSWTTAKGEAKTAWVVDYVDGAGKRRLKSFKLKKAADAFAATATVEVREGIHVADSASVTVETAGELWITSGLNAGLEQSTMKQRRSHLDIHIKPLIGSTLLSKITVPTVRDFEDRMRRDGRSAIMTRKVLTSLGSILSDASERGLATRNPVRDIRSGRKGRDRRAERRQKGRIEVGVDIPTREEIKALVGALDDAWRPLLITAIFSGMRSSELRGLRWQDVDFKRNLISVNQRIDAYGVVGAPKSEAGTRKIPVPPLVLNALKEHRLRSGGNSLLVFGNDDGASRTHASIVRSGLIPAMIRAGVVVATGEVRKGEPAMAAKYTGLHSLRHFYASWCINRREDGGLGLPAKMVQERLGHASIVMTMDVYGHLFPRDDAEDELAAAATALLS